MYKASAIISVFLLCGVAVQSFGYYLLLCFVPGLLFWRTRFAPEFYKRMRKLAVGLLLIWIIFPITNVFNYLNFSSVPLSFAQLMKSHVTSALAISAGALFFYSWKDRLFKAGTREPVVQESYFIPFLKGLVITSCITCLYLFCEQRFGTNFLGTDFTENRRMAGGLFRAPGFYSHPLTLAGVGLALFAFTATLALQKTQVLTWWQNSLLVFAAFYFVLASGGRVALILVVLFAVCAYVLSFRKVLEQRHLLSQGQRMALYALLPAIPILLWMMLFSSGMDSRFFALMQGSGSPEFERLTFWKVHWRMFLDQPILGHGIALLNAYKRDQYYELLGYGALTDKYPAHNLPLEILCDVGLVGAAVLVFAVWWIWRAFSYKASAERRVFQRAFVAAVLLNLFNGLTQNVFFDASVMYIYLSLLILMLWSDASEFEK